MPHWLSRPFWTFIVISAVRLVLGSESTARIDSRPGLVRMQKPRQGTYPEAGQYLDSWAWVELNYRPHAYQAASCEHELRSEVPTRLPFTNILLSPSPIQEHLVHFREHFAHLNGHRNGHRSPCRCLIEPEEPFPRRTPAACPDRRCRSIHDPIFSPDAAHHAPNSHYLPGILLANGELIAVAVQHRGPRGVDHTKMDIELRADRRRAKIAKEFCASGSPRVCDNILRH